MRRRGLLERVQVLELRSQLEACRAHSERMAELSSHASARWPDADDRAWAHQAAADAASEVQAAERRLHLAEAIAEARGERVA